MDHTYSAAIYLDLLPLQSHSGFNLPSLDLASAVHSAEIEILQRQGPDWKRRKRRGLLVSFWRGKEIERFTMSFMFLPILFEHLWKAWTWKLLWCGDTTGQTGLELSTACQHHPAPTKIMTTSLLYLTVPCMVLFHLGVGCLLFNFFWIVFFGEDFCFFKDFFVCSAWAAFLAICCILELKSVFCMHFGAKNPLFACLLGFWLLAFGFWLLAFGFWLWLHLASLGFTWLTLAYLGLPWLMAVGFGFTWLWFWPFTSLGSWRLLGFVL